MDRVDRWYLDCLFMPPAFWHCGAWGLCVSILCCHPRLASCLKDGWWRPATHPTNTLCGCGAKQVSVKCLHAIVGSLLPYLAKTDGWHSCDALCANIECVLAKCVYFESDLLPYHMPWVMAESPVEGRPSCFLNGQSGRGVGMVVVCLCCLPLLWSSF